MPKLRQKDIIFINELKKQELPEVEVVLDKEKELPPYTPGIDFLIIQGWYTFREVLVQYFNWKKYINPNGIVIFHNTINFPSVKRAIKEIRRTEDLEFVGGVESLSGCEAYRKLPDKRGSSVFFGPWIGEFGWELGWWHGYCRKESHKYNYVITSTFPGRELLYQDFADEILIHNYQGEPLCGYMNKIEGDFEIPDTTNIVFPSVNHMYANEEQEFVQFGKDAPNYKYDIMLHMPYACHPNYHVWSKRYPYWEELVQTLISHKYTIASYGLNDDSIYSLGQDGWLEGTKDLRNIPLGELVSYLAGCRVVIGGVSGATHLASYCGSDIIVWPKKGSIDTKVRFETVMNPFNSKVVVLDEYDDFCPPVDRILEEVKKFEKES